MSNLIWLQKAQLEMASKLSSTVCGKRRSMGRQCMWAAFRASMIKLRSLSGLHRAILSSVKVKEESAREE